MRAKRNNFTELLTESREKIASSLAKDGVVILPPLDVAVSSRLLHLLGFQANTTIFDPWFNKGVGGKRNDYIDYIVTILNSLKDFSEHIFLWGFPEIVAHFVDRIPPPLELQCWITWFYKNSPSMIRGWRSAQMTCLHLVRPGAKMHVENFLNEVQLERLKQGTLRFIPGPPSVIEEPLLCGFVGRKEQTGHPSQKPVSVIEKLILMGTARGELVVDLMSGSGTTAEAAYNNERFSIICDISDEYTQIAENRMSVRRIGLNPKVLDQLETTPSGLRAKRIKMPFKNGRLQLGVEEGRNRQLTLGMK